MKSIGIIAAMPGELKPLVQGWKALTLPNASKGEAAWRGTLEGAECIAVCAGMGNQAAERACKIASQQASLTALVSIGWAGALSCGVQPGNAYVINEVIDGVTTERYATTQAVGDGNRVGLKLVTIDHVALPPEKRKIAEAFRAILVDMEAATVARYARARGLDFYCLKAVSDLAGEILPDFSQYTDPQGQLQLPALLAHVAIRPRYWPALARLGQNGKRGAVAIAAAMDSLVGGV
jgi:adenosylhomocysteine nucleosidase